MEDLNYTNELNKFEKGMHVHFSDESGLSALNAFKKAHDQQAVPSHAMWKVIRTTTQGERDSNSKATKRDYFRRILLVAAVVLIAVVAVINIEKPATKKSALAQTKQEYKSVTINNQAEIELRNYSNLAEVKNTDNVYRVYLDGEASVKVQKRESQYFEIETATALIRVLGTTFTVLAQNNETVVYLEEGKIQFNKKGETEKQFMNPGDIVSIGHEGINFLPSTEIKTYTAWMNNEMVMDSRKLSSVADEIQRHYNVIISLPSSVQNEQISGTLPLTSLKEVFKSIELIVGGGEFVQTSERIYHWKKRDF
jgi:ferric-dicitrate binding protein FerR (iron transport regulator)